MAWGVKDVSEQRMEFVVRAGSGKEPMAELCREFQISRPTGYLWLGRYRESERLQELQERSRRPLRSPKQTAPEIEQRVVALRRQYPDWGAPKLVTVLKREGIQLPISTTHRILRRQGLVREADRHRKAVQRFQREQPNELWQMDFKGMPNDRPGCVPLSILDDHSRYAPGLFDLPGLQAKAVQQKLEMVFQESGLPEGMLMDHGTPWWNMQSQSGWTWLTVWLMKLGIRVYLSGYRHPQTQGKIERFHGSLEAAMFKRPKGARQNWQEWLDLYRYEYNHVRPHAALQMTVPSQHWSPSPRRYCADGRVWEYPDPARVRKVAENGGVRWEGRGYFVSRAFIGEHVQLRPLENRMLIYFCNTLVREIDFATRRSYHADHGQFQRARTQGLLANPTTGAPPLRPLPQI